VSHPMQKKAGYRRIDHTADVGIVVFGPSEKALFETAAKALSALLAQGHPSTPGITESLDIKGTDRADLLVNWLRELLYLWSGRGLLVQETEVGDIDANRLSATVRLHPYEPGRLIIQNDIKAVTYHQISVEKTPAGWEAKVIFDV